LSLRAAVLGLLLAALSCAAWAAGPERALSGVLEAIEANRLDLATRRVEALIAAHPNFRLAHLIRGDLLMARAHALQTFGNVPKTVPREKVEDLRIEALLRLRALRDRPSGDRVPRNVLQLDADQHYALLVDSRRSRLYVFENAGGRPQLVADYYVTLGKNGVEKTREGDQRTPIGVYHVTANLPRQKLTDFYGVGAYPLNYPNAWDKHLGRNGHGIWLHGTPSETYSRPPWATDGCVVLTNDDLARLSKYVDVSRTPVVIGQSIQWRNPRSWEADREAFLAAFTRWKKDWESLDTDRYLSHYSSRFRTDKRGLVAWKARKHQVNAGKAWVKVGVEDLSLFAYPGTSDMMMVTFEQDYRSSNMSKRTMKRQYWVRENGEWRILHESVVS
jgi:murein L,D-transpeptidase YafK